MIYSPTTETVPVFGFILGFLRKFFWEKVFQEKCKGESDYVWFYIQEMFFAV